jgi:hypothetical protein
MDPHRDLAALFEDLEQQADGMELAARDAELVDRVQGEYAAVAFDSRVHASVGRSVVLVVTGVGTLRGVLTSAGRTWCLLAPESSHRPWLVRLAAIEAASGLSSRALPEELRPAVARLGFGSAVRRLAEHRDVVVHGTGGGRRRVRVVRVGADFAEALDEGQAGGSVLLTFAALAAVRPD